MYTNYRKDVNGNYFLNGQRMLVSYMRGDFKPVKNPVKSQFEPEYIVELYKGPVGVVVAFIDNGELRLGFSKANIWRGDKFDRNIGLHTSIERAMIKNIQPPFEEYSHNMDIYDALNKMYNRACNYFKLKK